MAETIDSATAGQLDPKITALHLGNFKAFGETQRAPLRPLTIVFGPNSSGKSSIIHSLLFGHEALTSKKANSLDVHRPQLGGESVDLGGFRQFVFRRDPANRLEWGCELDIARLPDGLSAMLEGAKSLAASVTIQWHRYFTPATPPISVADLAAKLGVSVEAVLKELAKFKQHFGRLEPETELEGIFQAIVELQIRKAQLEEADDADAVPDMPDLDTFMANEVVRDEDGLAVQGPRVSGYTITVDGTPLLRASLKGSGLDWRMKVDVLDTDHPVVRSLLEAMVLSQTSTDGPADPDVQAAMKTALDEMVPSLTLDRGKFIPIGLTTESLTALQRFQFKDDEHRPARAVDIEKTVRLFLPNSIQRLIRGIGEAASTRLLDLHYLGPLRSYPARHLAFAEDEDGNWLAGGGFAWDIVRQDADIRRRVNRWLGAEFMKTPYELTLQLLYDIDDLEKSFDEVVEEVRSDERLRYFEELCGNMGEDFEEVIQEEDIEDSVLSIASGYVTEDLERARKGKWPRPEGVTDFDRLTDATKQELEPIRDLWLIDKRTSTKVSHRDVGIGVSQVLPVLVSAFAHKNAILAMEQPELHLHPALQAELGDVVIDSAMNGRNTFILETHSEHLILRILRRIRETSAGKNNATAAVKPEDIAMLYVQPGPEGAIITELRVDAHGRLLDPCPDGFFEEDFQELF